jgi:hypothetical protein
MDGCGYCTFGHTLLSTLDYMACLQIEKKDGFEVIVIEERS